ncbi:acyltransferase family protein [Morganella morganii]|uniref:acyltransferase family protein n=1 Tax=Morganella morganii TaxID=582 RepID=UPI0034E60371
MDSFRFFLASGVMMSHSIYMYSSISGGGWVSQSQHISSYAWYGVSIFFSLTGFLFWNKIRNDSDPDWIRIYIDRFFRIVPLLFINTTIIVVIIALYSYLKSSSLSGSSNIIYWYDFLNNYKPDIFNVSNSKIFTAGVYWTLVYEWGFYFSLPLLWILGRKHPFAFAISLCFLVVYVSPNITFEKGVYTYSFLHFIIGILACELSKSIKVNAKKLDIVLLVSIIIILAYGSKLSPYSTSGYGNAIILLIMICLSFKTSLFGLLNIRGFVLLGEASYSIYIMHPVIIYSTLKLLNHFNILKDNCIPSLIFSYFMTYIISAITFIFIEKKFISYGKTVTL